MKNCLNYLKKKRLNLWGGVEGIKLIKREKVVCWDVYEGGLDVKPGVEGKGLQKRLPGLVVRL